MLLKLSEAKAYRINATFFLVFGPYPFKYMKVHLKALRYNCLQGNFPFKVRSAYIHNELSIRAQ